MEQIYHLFIKKECNHNCPLCCNKQYDISKLPVVTVEDLVSADVVCLTGGEPFMIPPGILLNLCKRLKKQYSNIKKLYIYSSNLNPTFIDEKWWTLLYEVVDGVNIAPKTIDEWKYFHYLVHTPWFRDITDTTGPWEGMENTKSNRLYVFEDQQAVYDSLHWDLPISWQVIGRKWDKVFNTPDNEHFVRLPILY